MIKLSAETCTSSQLTTKSEERLYIRWIRNLELLLLTHGLLDEASSTRWLPFKFAGYAGNENAPSMLSTMHLGIKTLPYVNTTLCTRDARFMGQCGGARQISQPYVPVLRCARCPHSKCRLVPVIHRVAVQTARRPRTEIGAKAVLPDPSIVEGQTK